MVNAMSLDEARFELAESEDIVAAQAAADPTDFTLDEPIRDLSQVQGFSSGSIRTVMAEEVGRRGCGSRDWWVDLDHHDKNAC